MKDQPTVSRRDVLAAGLAAAAMTMTPASRAQTPAGDSPNVVLITGTSSGFGRLMAENFAAEGLRVVASMRAIQGRNAPAAAELRALAAGKRLALDVVEIDVTDQASVDRGVAEALRLAGRIDILINNAGVTVPGPLGLQPVADFDANIETNLNGSLRVFQAVAPQMRARKRGYLIQMSSGLGRMVMPGLGGYCASKAAVEAAADAISYEEAASGIGVTIVQPAGAYPTRLQSNAQRYLEQTLERASTRERSHRAVFDEQLAGIKESLVADGKLNPREVSDAVLRLIPLPRAERPRRLVVGPYREGVETINRAHDQVQAMLAEH